MLSSYSTALSGLNAMSTAIDIVGNNLANLNTTGYKEDRADFKDLVAQSLGGDSQHQVGLGTAAPITSRIFSQGTITQTQSSYDAAINGNGFFVVKNGDGQSLYTRDGSFTVDQSGYLKTSTGEYVQGWSAQNGVLNSSGALGNIQLPIGQNLPPQATTQITLAGNLSSSAQAGTAAGTFTQQVQAVDSLGNTVPLNMTFTKSSTVSGQWDYAVTTPGGPVVAGGTGSIQFDSSGAITSPTAANGNIALSVSGLTDGASNMNVNWNLYNSDGTPRFTQFSEASSISSQSQNGQVAAQLTGVSLQNGGNVVATYSNGAQQQVVAQLAVAGVRNPESLVDVGNNNFSLGANTAAPTVGTAGTGGRGAVDGESLEGSTVDIASEFSNLLVYERSYQANSRVVTVSDQLAQEAVNLVHS
jgi:flagellar hook protein FlgE